MQMELELLENKELRESKLDRIDVLEKTGTLLMLPEIFVATSEQVSNFFKISISTLNSLILDNLKELEENDLLTLKGSDFIDIHVKSLKNVTWEKHRANYKIFFKNETLNIGGKGIRIFTKRTILNIAMLLRDSEVAKEIRARLLDVVEEAPEAIKKTIKKINKEKEIFQALSDYAEDELTAKKLKKIIFETLEKMKFQRRKKIMEVLLLEIEKVESSLKTDEIAKAYELVKIKNEINEHLFKRTTHSKFLLVTKKDKQIRNLSLQLKEKEWKPNFSINLNYPGFSKNAMYQIIGNKLVTSKAYRQWQKNFPKELLKVGLVKEFYTEPFEWKIGGKIFERFDPSNLITPIQDEIARILKRDDKEMFFQGFVMDEMETVDAWGKSKIKIYFKLLKK